LSAYHQLTCFGGWEKVDAVGNKVTIRRTLTRLFDCEKEKWAYEGTTTINLYSNCKFEVLRGALSLFDVEVLESLQFEEI